MARAIFAALIATAVASALIFMNGQALDLPQVPLLADISSFNTRIGMPSGTEGVWASHVILGILVYGVIFALIQPILPGNGLVEGISFGILTWLVMMVVFAPLVGHELFMTDLDGRVMGMLAGLNLVYGAVLGVGYAAFGGRTA
ncbi:DUF6789 family protein [Acuticoccus yangtzensis]|uniref:DUF6789 family protein n=1 Tax=Acuticoccus yangtzensis TaxID=1443441 RepID=UPI0009497D79|nr:DUF6789 family protein [Acuticoccus yangtzensis]ORE94461.1 hypothetical protein ATO13_10316 [Stappia sp. 22II-S9-Z10]